MTDKNVKIARIEGAERTTSKVEMDVDVTKLTDEELAALLGEG